MFPSNCNDVHSTPAPPLLLCSSLFFSPGFWGLLGLTVSCNHSTLCLFRVKACRKCHPKFSVSLWSSDIWGFGEMWKIQLSFLYRKTAVISVLYIVVTLFKISPVFSYNTDALLLREDYVKDLRLWKMSSGKSQWSGLRFYCPWLSALPLHRGVWTPDSSTECACATAAPVAGLVPRFESRRKWIYATAENQKHWGVGMLPLADSPKTNVLDLFCSLAL